MQTQKENLPFCSLSLKLYSTGNKSPKMEYSASSTKAQFQCSLTKKYYSVFEIIDWLNTAEVQTYVRLGYVIKWGSRIEQQEPTKWSNGLVQIINCFMVKPFNKSGFSSFKPINKSTTQINKSNWVKENPTDFNTDLYEQELANE